MYQIIIKYKDGKEEIIEEQDYTIACQKANVWSKYIKSVHLKEVTK